jgi:hypothetical protein
MKERPILFSTEMVRAILDGRKTQTRRLHNHGEIGDRLWVRETWKLSSGHVWFKADGEPPQEEIDMQGGRWRWRPSIFLPRVFSRIILEITGVRQERLQDITNTDRIAEGILKSTNRDMFLAFQRLWDSINAKRGYAWDTNPMVWAIEFKII